MEQFNQFFDDCVDIIFEYQERADGGAAGAVVAAFKPSFRRLNSSLRRAGSARYSRPRPQSAVLLQAAVIPAHQCDEGNKYKEHPDDPATWSASFEKLLECSWGLQTFADFLKKEFSAENIYFWTACERFKRLNPGLERTAEAQRIYQQHLCVGAPEAVNVDSKARQYTEQALQDGSPTLFNHAQKQIFNLMKFDSYTRFLKSDLYNQCLSGNVQKYDLETGLLTYPMSMVGGKLKKSLSNAEDRRRKSLLPWHRKNRSRSKDRGELEYNNNNARNSDMVNGNNGGGGGGGGSETHHSVSSLTSIDLAMHHANNHDCNASMVSDDSLSVSSLSGRSALCRVILDNGSTTVVQIQRDPAETVAQLIGRLLAKRGLHYSHYLVHSDKHSRPIDTADSSLTLAGCEVTVEWRVAFRLLLPNDKVIGVKSKCSKRLVEILRPILLKYSFHIDQVRVELSGQPLNVNMPITEIDGARIAVLLKEQINTLSKPKSVVKPTATLEEITNRVYEDILLEKSDIVNTKSEKGSVKSEDWGSEHSSSSILGRFLRRDSTHPPPSEVRKKKLLPPSSCRGRSGAAQQQASSSQSSAEDVSAPAAAGQGLDTQCNGGGLMKKPLIAKWRTGVKLQVACSETDGVSRLLRSRLEDQRGTEINYDLPDFLKSHNNNISNGKLRKLQQLDTAQSLDSSLSRIVRQQQHSSPSNSNYENRTILVSSPDKTCPVVPVVSSPSNDIDTCSSRRLMEPPPLPPKPKVLPMRPSNWGGLTNKMAAQPTTNLILDQQQTTASSFV